jgi:PelA/Pel-15E family pectate lyase
MEAFNKGVECMLRTQIVYNGELTVWCQQHDRETFLPAKARAYELPSFCSQESAGITGLLMSLPNPDERVKKAVHAAMAWFDKHKIMGLRIKRTGKKGDPNANVELVSDPAAKPIWGRFYDLTNCEPYVCDRDGIPRKHLEEIGVERRTGYSWYGSEPAKLYPVYERWASRYDPDHKINISLNTPSTSGASPSR